MQSAAAKFFSAKQFAVAGASSIPSKFGYKIHAWYLSHNLPAIPMNPTAPKVTVDGKDYDTVPGSSKLSDPSNTSLSVITPPPVTAKVLQEAKEAGIPAVWLQPGSFTEAEMKYATENFPGGAVGGFAEGTVGGEGWCVLVDGDEAMRAAEKLKTNGVDGAKKEVKVKPKRQVEIRKVLVVEIVTDADDSSAENLVSNGRVRKNAGFGKAKKTKIPRSSTRLATIASIMQLSRELRADRDGVINRSKSDGVVHAAG